MRAWRNKSLKTHEFGPWKFENSTLADKLKVQRHLRDVNEQLRQARLNYYATEPHGQEHEELYAKHFRVHKRRGYEVHELIIEQEC